MEANYFIILWWFLPHIDMDQPWMYMWPTILNPSPHLLHHLIPLGCPSAPTFSALFHALNLDWSSVSHNINVSMLFSQIIPPSSSPTESKSLFFRSVSLLLSRIQGYCYHISKFHIYALVYCIGVFLSGLLHSVYIISSSFIHLIRTDSNAFCLMAE